MGRYVARRLLIAVPTLVVISFVVYAILALAPGDPLAQFAANPNVPPEVRENLRRSLGLDQPWPELDTTQFQPPQMSGGQLRLF